jgi:hypothetical protein
MEGNIELRKRKRLYADKKWKKLRGLQTRERNRKTETGKKIKEPKIED